MVAAVFKIKASVEHISSNDSRSGSTLEFSHYNWWESMVGFLEESDDEKMLSSLCNAHYSNSDHGYLRIESFEDGVLSELLTQMGLSGMDEEFEFHIAPHHVEDGDYSYLKVVGLTVE